MQIQIHCAGILSLHSSKNKSFQIFLQFFGAVFCLKHRESPLQANPRIATVVGLLLANADGSSRPSTPDARNNNKDKPHLNDSENQRLQNSMDWQTFATIMDRIFFTIYVVVLIFMLAFYFPWSADTSKYASSSQTSSSEM